MKKLILFLTILTLSLLLAVPAFASSSMGLADLQVLLSDYPQAYSNLLNGYWSAAKLGGQSTAYIMMIPNVSGLNGHYTIDSYGYIRDGVRPFGSTDNVFIRLTLDYKTFQHTIALTSSAGSLARTYFDEGKLTKTTGASAGGLDTFLALIPTPPQEPFKIPAIQTTQNLVDQLGRTLKILLPVGLTIFSVLLLPPLIKRVPTYFQR